MAIYNELREPNYEDFENQPKTLTVPRNIDGIMYVAGRAPVEGRGQYDIMFVTTSVENEEAEKNKSTSLGFTISQPPEYLKGSNGIIKDLALHEGVDMDKDCYYTAVCKWLLPPSKRARPSVKAMKWGMPILEDEIARVKPKIIVCLGKPAFDMLGDTKISFKDAHGGWFYSARYEAHLYVMNAPYSLVTKPELYEGFRIDFAEIKRKYDIIQGRPIKDEPIRYSILDSLDKVNEWVDKMIAEGFRLFSTDCEWHGRTYFDMDLRTIQFAWTESDAVVVEFRDENNKWSFDLGDDFVGSLDPAVSDREGRLLLYQTVGKALQRVMNLPDTRFIGHHFSADAPPMEYWLGIDTYTKCILDTEFAQQCIDESSELGLERGIAMKYTTLGLYDLDLTLWKKSNKDLCVDGYGFIPRELLLPYSVKYVIAADNLNSRSI